MKRAVSHMPLRQQPVKIDTPAKKNSEIQDPFRFNAKEDEGFYLPRNRFLGLSTIMVLICSSVTPWAFRAGMKSLET